MFDPVVASDPVFNVIPAFKAYDAVSARDAVPNNEPVNDCAVIPPDTNKLPVNWCVSSALSPNLVEPDTCMVS